MQRGKSQTVKVKSHIKPQNSKLSNNFQIGQNYGASHENTNTAKENVKRTLNEIEDKIKTFKYLPNQKLHPFDLTAEELVEIKQYFPEFFPKNLAAKRQTQLKGIEIVELQQLLKQKIQIKPEALELIIAKLDHKSESRISWTEFLAFLQNEGLRREVVNDAQLYGFGVKRLIEKGRIKLDVSKEQKSNEKAVEYFVDHLVNIKLDKLHLVLAVFENNQARLYDSRDFKVVQEIQFPIELINTNKHAARRQHSMKPASSFAKNDQKSNTASRQQSTIRDNIANDYLTETNVLESIAEKPQKREKSAFGFNTQANPNFRPKSQAHRNIIPRQRYVQKDQKEQNVIRVKSQLERKNSGENSSVKYQGDPSIIAWKKAPFIRSSTVMDDQLREKTDAHILGLADMSAFYPTYEDRSIINANKAHDLDETLGQIKIKDFFPNFKQQKQHYEESFNKKIDEISRSLTEQDKIVEKQYKKLIREERARGLTEIEAVQSVFKQLGISTHYSQQLIKQHTESEILKRKMYSDRCQIKLASLKTSFNQQSEKLADLKETNQYGLKMASVDQFLTGAPSTSTSSRNNLNDSSVEESQQEQKNSEVNDYMIKKYIEKLKARGELQHDPEAKSNSALAKLDQSKKLIVKNTKAVNVTACDFNQSVGFLALALIDKEVKIYKFKQNGTKVALMEHFSFYVNFHSGGSVSCLQIERYITNGRPIVCMGSQLGDIAMYYLDDEKRLKEGKGPALLRQFNFNERGIKVELDDINKDSDFEEDHKPVRISFRSNERSHLNPVENYGKQSEDKTGRAQDASELITDDYWDSVLMNTRTKKEGPDGIKLWNLIYPKLKDADSAQCLVKELTDLKITDTSNMGLIINTWITCLRISGNILEDARTTFRLEYQKILNPQYHQQQKSIRTNSILKNFSSQGKPQINANSNKQRKNSSFSHLMQQTQSDQNQSTYGGVTNTEQDPFNKSTLGTRSTMMATKRSTQAITAIKYVEDIGLIATTFNGVIKIFDSFNFYQIWKNTNQNRTTAQHSTITAFDVSSQLGLMATVGVEGRLVLIDPYALGIINATDAHPNTEVLRVFIYSSQQQIITVAADRSIYLWDAFRLERIQAIKDLGATFATKFTAVSFDEQTGNLCAGCQQINYWKAVVDSKTEIQALQVQTLSKTVMKERNMFELANLGGQKKQVMTTAAESRSGKVLVSNQSQLVSILINNIDKNNLVISVDSENLLRGWSMIDCSTSFSYKIPMNNRVTAAALDEKCKHIAVGSSLGEVKVLNFASGGLLYSLPHADQEITCLKFLSGVGEFWLVSGCWNGKVLLWTEPNEDNNFQITAKCRIGHRGDVLVVDSAFNYIISGGMDGLLSVWNQFSGVLKFAVTLPDPIDESRPGQSSSVQNQIRKKITDVLFHPSWQNVVCVLQESGNVHLVDISNGSVIADFIAYMKLNSCWAVAPNHQLVFVVGDMGRASLFNISMNTGNVYNQATTVSSKANKVPVYTNGYIKDYKWSILKPWFRAHQIGKMDSCYVQSACYSSSSEIFVSATSSGEVKLWSIGKGRPALFALGTLNAKDWSSDTIMSYLNKTNMLVEEQQDQDKDGDILQSDIN